ncbi:probable CCR4-associated factor 1 homolog 11 [Phragmites australis]|uniref:probable CCR4-associated factor 1 homolog 11 n=1 Tax=Phragmites australis TaxID=29695 RepID=UPI002D7759F7|nr:probable CCR4-associated factor 1 homolog 11 [Phragmites australis]
MNSAGAFYLARPAWYPAVPMLPLPPPFGVPVHAVWADNLDAQLGAVQYFAARARCVAVTVHYPGVVHGASQDQTMLTAEQRYAIVKANVDALKPLQVGLSICTHDGRLAAWEFNLSGFDPAVDPYAAHSVSYLAFRGLDVDAHRLNGIPMTRLTTALRFCGLVYRPGISWTTYAGAYHVAYLMKVISGGNKLPGDMARFLGAVRRCLGEVYDVARMAGDCQDMPVGLERVASRLRLAPPLFSSQLAGAGSVLALQAFMILRCHEFQGDLNRHRGVLQGLQAI